MENQMIINNNTNTVYEFVPDTPLLTATLTFANISNFSLCPYQRHEANILRLTENEIKSMKEYANNFVNLNNRWWIHKKAIPYYAEEFPDMMNLIKLNQSNDTVYEIVPDTPVLPIEPSLELDFPTDPHQIYPIDTQGFTDDKIDELKKRVKDFVIINKSWCIHKKAIPIYAEFFPRLFNLSFN